MQVLGKEFCENFFFLESVVGLKEGWAVLSDLPATCRPARAAGPLKRRSKRPSKSRNSWCQRRSGSWGHLVMFRYDAYKVQALRHISMLLINIYLDREATAPVCQNTSFGVSGRTRGAGDPRASSLPGEFSPSPRFKRPPARLNSKPSKSSLPPAPSSVAGSQDLPHLGGKDLDGEGLLHQDRAWLQDAMRGQRAVSVAGDKDDLDTGPNLHELF